MNCNVCDPNGMPGGFTTHAQFHAEESRIKDLISDGLVTTAPGPTGFEVTFSCNSCGQSWELVAPDWPMRGFLRKISSREPRLSALRAKHGRTQP